MQIYVTLANFTEQGIRNVKQSPARLDAAKKLIKKLGGDMKLFFLTIGPYDMVMVSEFPDDEAAARFALAVGSLGNIRTTTLKAFSETQYRKIIGALK